DSGPSSLLLAFLWSTVAYVAVVSNLVEIGENDRFRLYTDPLVLVLVAALAVTWRARRRRPTATTGTGKGSSAPPGEQLDPA
ncbi:MAG: hypothetical protein M3P53_06190, partial [Actinomycetota bacterium]|nr:hypothetical protein [Actinomycetota bacterium]